MHLSLVISSLEAGGAERILSELANHWVSRGHRVTLLTLAHPSARPYYPLSSLVHVIQLNQSLSESPAKSWLWTRLRTILRRVFCLRTVLQTLKPDLIISFVDVMNLTTLLAGMRLKIPIIVSERTDPAFHVLPKLYTLLRTVLYPLAQCIVVQTQNAADYFPRSFKKYIKIIANPVKSPPQKVLNSHCSNLISVGRLDPEKDHKTLIQAFSQIHKEYPPLQLSIYGEGPERVRLEQLIQSLGLQDHVVLPGTTKDIQNALLNSDIFIFPSRYEGFPNALCEAMATGLPVIASNCSGNVDIVRDGADGRLFPVGDVMALIQIMRELMEDRAQREKLARRALEVCVRFHPDVIFQCWDQLISETEQH